MNPYTISPGLTTAAVDPVLTSNFATLDANLRWRPLTTNLESCESPPYLYFRISLQLRPGHPTFAGFATGAPFILTRDIDVKKRAFFLRHWVRNEPHAKPAIATPQPVPHMSIAVHDAVMLVRVDIDRPLDTADTFRSIPFATIMFQVAQVDAVVHNLPGVRFAFAIERTITAEEREVVLATGRKLTSKGPRPSLTGGQQPLPPVHATTSALAYKQHVASVPRPARPLLGHSLSQTLASAVPTSHSVPPLAVAPRPPMAYKTLNPRPPSASFQTYPYAYTSSRHLSSQARQTLAARPPYIGMHQQFPKVPMKSYARPSASIAPQSAQNGGDPARPVLHPYLKMWEDRDLDDPYEPIFITEDPKFDVQTNRSWMIEEAPEHAKRFEYQEFFGVPTADYPSFYFEGPELVGEDGDPDVEMVIQRKQKVNDDTSELTSTSGDEGAAPEPDAAAKYSAIVVAAAEYNSSLRKDRGALRNWLLEEQGREEEESEDDEDDDEGDGDSSD